MKLMQKATITATVAVMAASIVTGATLYTSFQTKMPSVQMNVQVDEAQRQEEFRNNALIQVKNNFEVSWNDFWHSDKLTPQQHCDILGKNASKLFSYFTATANYIIAVDPSYVPPSWPVQPKFNKDGTVTIK